MKDVELEAWVCVFRVVYAVDEVFDFEVGDRTDVIRIVVTRISDGTSIEYVITSGAPVTVEGSTGVASGLARFNTVRMSTLGDLHILGDSFTIPIVISIDYIIITTAYT